MKPRPGNFRFLMIFCSLLVSALLARGQTAPAVAPMGAPGNDAFQAAKPLQEPHDKAALIRLNAPVDEMMLKSVERRVDIARKAGCTLIVFDMDTYGGLVTSALEISKLIKKLPDEHINTVAWVHDKAYSAGAMISVSCQQIVMTRQGSLGDCAPIVIEGNSLVPVPETERAKMNAPVLQEFDDSAQKNGYNPAVLRAMVDVAVEVHELHNTRTGETAFVDAAEKDKKLAQQTPLPGGGIEHPWQYVGDKPIDDSHSLLTVGADMALKMRLSSATINNQQELKAALNIRGDLLELNYSPAERATVFLTDWWVRGFLFVGMLVFAWLEFSHPGMTLFGIVAVLCLILLVGAPFLTGLAQVWEIALIVLGLGIVVADLLFFGTMGLLAVPGFILMAIGLVASFVPSDPGGGFLPTRESSWVALEQGLGVMVGGTFLALVAFYLFAKYLYLTPGFSRLQLAPAGTSLTSANTTRVPGGLSPGPRSESVIRDAADRPADDAVFVGAIGRAATDLRPAGKGRFGDHLVGVVSYGNFIEKNSEIEVLEASGLRVVVKPHLTPGLSPPSDEPHAGLQA